MQIAGEAHMTIQWKTANTRLGAYPGPWEAGSIARGREAECRKWARSVAIWCFRQLKAARGS